MVGVDHLICRQPDSRREVLLELRRQVGLGWLEDGLEQRLGHQIAVFAGEDVDRHPHGSGLTSMELECAEVLLVFNRGHLIAGGQ